MEVAPIVALIPVAFILFVIFIIGISILAFIFWIFMIIDVAKRKFQTDGEKIAWVLVVILAGILGAIIYYFVIKRKK